MASARLSGPAVQALVAAAIAAVSWGALAWGVGQPGALTATETTRGGLAIGLALAPAIMAPMFLLLALRGVRAVRAARAGKDELARWTVTAEELAQFRRDDQARTALGREYRNRWKPPRRNPPGGLEVIFVPDAAVVGGKLFPLVTTGNFRFAGVQVLPGRPLALEFGIVETSMAAEPSFRVWRDEAVLRLPVARRARDELPRVLRHFQQVDARDVIVHPHRFRRAARWGAVVALVCLLAMAPAGFWLARHFERFPQPHMLDVALVLTIVGAIGGLGALCFAAIAWMLHRAQHGR